tara:strand:- start:7686 stop:9158 length:1473 start_codon:yes stop_codon:yes gene_type:complete
MAQIKGNNNASGFGVPGTQGTAIKNVASGPSVSPNMPVGPQLAKQAQSSYQKGLMGGGAPKAAYAPPRAAVPPLAKAPPSTGYQLMSGLPQQDMMSMNRTLGMSAFTELPGAPVRTGRAVETLPTVNLMGDRPVQEMEGYRALGRTGRLEEPETFQTFARQTQEEDDEGWRGWSDWSTGGGDGGDPYESRSVSDIYNLANQDPDYDNSFGGTSLDEWAAANGYTKIWNEITDEWDYVKGTPPEGPPPWEESGGGVPWGDDGGGSGWLPEGVGPPTNEDKADSFLEMAGGNVQDGETIGFPEEKLVEAHALIDDSATQAYEMGLQQLSRQHAMMGMTGSGSSMVANNALLAQIYNDALQQHMALDLKNLEQMEVDEQEAINNALQMAQAYISDAMSGAQLEAADLNNLLGVMQLVNEELATSFSNMLTSAGIEYGHGTAALINWVYSQVLTMYSEGTASIDDIMAWAQEQIDTFGLASVTPDVEVQVASNV